MGHLTESRRGVWLAVAIIAALFLAVASPAGAAAAPGTIPISSSYAYTLVPDDTFWLTGPGYVSHLDEDGDPTSGGFSSSGIQHPYATACGHSWGGGSPFIGSDGAEPDSLPRQPDG